MAARGGEIGGIGGLGGFGWSMQDIASPQGYIVVVEGDEIIVKEVER